RHGDAHQAANAENREQPRSRNAFHQRGAREASRHESDLVTEQVVGGHASGRPRYRLLREPNYKTSNADLRTHIKELRNHSLNKVPVSKDTFGRRMPEFYRVVCALRHVWQMG